MDRGAWQATLHGVAKELDVTEQQNSDNTVQLLSCVRLFVTPWTAACQASLSFTISRRLLKLMSIELLMPSNHSHPLLPPSPAFDLS